MGIFSLESTEAFLPELYTASRKEGSAPAAVDEAQLLKNSSNG